MAWVSTALGSSRTNPSGLNSSAARCTHTRTAQMSPSPSTPPPLATASCGTTLALEGTNCHRHAALPTPTHPSSTTLTLAGLPLLPSLVMNDTMTQWRSNATQQLDFWVTTTPANMTAGTSPYAPLMHRYVDVTGHPPPMPHFASGFWQSKNRYRNQSQVLDIARGYVTRSLPLSVIVIDVSGMGERGPLLSCGM